MNVKGFNRNELFCLKIYRIIKELKDRKKPQLGKPITTVNKSRSPDLLFANRTLLKNFYNFPRIINVFLVTFLPIRESIEYSITTMDFMIC